jgi:hypothetical protein
MMAAFIRDHRDQYGVEPICAVLPVAPSTYFRHEAARRDPTQRSARAQRDETLRAAIQRVWDANYQVYGPRKVWKELKREGRVVARCTVQRLMRAMGLEGAVRGRAWVTTTTPAVVADRPHDLVERDFHASRPNQLWVADFTYVATWGGFVYVAFVIDAFARRIVGWRVSVSLRTDFVLDALDQALYDRRGDGWTDLSRHSRDDLDAVAAALNSRPRKTLGWKTPAEALGDHLILNQTVRCCDDTLNPSSTCRCGTRTGWPTPASPRPWGAKGTPTTTPWRNR